VLTKAVMDERKKAPFKNWEDATSRVKGLGLQKASSLSDQGVRIQGSAYAAKAADQKPAASKDVSTDKAAPKAAKPADAAAKPAPAKN
jgi:competence protein ComEA